MIQSLPLTKIPVTDTTHGIADVAIVFLVFLTWIIIAHILDISGFAEHLGWK